MRSNALINGLLLLLIASVLGGCAAINNTNFTPVRGDKIFEPGIGSVKLVDGIEIWTNGDPDKKYRVIGILELTHHEGVGLLSGYASLTLDSDLAKIAKEHNADGVVYFSRDKALSGFSSRGNARHDTTFQYAVVRYVGER